MLHKPFNPTTKTRNNHDHQRAAGDLNGKPASRPQLPPQPQNSPTTSCHHPLTPFPFPQGPITVELYTDHAPRTCANFSTLARRGYYDGTIFHRVIPNFMAQAGDPTGTGRGGASIYGDKFADEIDPSLRHTGAGVLSMANAGPNTNGSQFFLTLAPAPWLDGKHTIFGRVRAGMATLRRVGLVKTGTDDRPVEDVTIVKAQVVEGDDE